VSGALKGCSVPNVELVAVVNAVTAKTAEASVRAHHSIGLPLGCRLKAACKNSVADPLTVGLISAGILQNAQQLHPSAPQNDLRSEIGRWLDQAVAWSCPWMPQALWQPHEAAAWRCVAACMARSPQAA
jgi:hypothetical protein